MDDLRNLDFGWIAAIVVGVLGFAPKMLAVVTARRKTFVSTHDARYEKMLAAQEPIMDGMSKRLNECHEDVVERDRQIELRDKKLEECHKRIETLEDLWRKPR